MTSDELRNAVAPGLAAQADALNLEPVVELVRAAYEQGCMDTHHNYQPDRAPDFSEAANDYTAAALARLTPATAHDGDAT